MDDLPSLLHLWLQKMEESPEGLPTGLAVRARAAVAQELRKAEKQALEKAAELKRLAEDLEEKEEELPKELGTV